MFKRLPRTTRAVQSTYNTAQNRRTNRTGFSRNVRHNRLVIRRIRHAVVHSLRLTVTTRNLITNNLNRHTNRQRIGTPILNRTSSSSTKHPNRSNQASINSLRIFLFVNRRRQATSQASRRLSTLKCTSVKTYLSRTRT